MQPLELWGGHECTLNRVGGAIHDQTHSSGHHDRPGDLDRFADLGLKALRYPVLWERVDPAGRGDFDWRWTDLRLGRIRALGMRPIAGLLHHGSGPACTDLLDDGFAGAFAVFARAAAERYPWVHDWTPINEPLTTARFSALYGHWHPHAAGEKPFWSALLNQIDATRLAMAQIREVCPMARLIQTEDLGHTYATRALAHQARFDNTRRWMTWDLLEGRVTQGHPLWSRLEGFGFADQLSAIADHPCPADVLGVNHYLTSDRFLDHRTADYPSDRAGGNQFMSFADVEAVRVLLPAPDGLEGALDEAWTRYGRTLAVTESHNGCTREEQVRWIREAWQTCERLRGRGVEIEAVTAWALLGGHDWNSLLTRQAGHYEVGAFDVRSDPPRATAVAAELKRLSGGGVEPAGTQGGGWWTRDIRLAFKPVFRTVESPSPRREWRAADNLARPLLIVGATGTLGKALARACEWRGIAYRLTGRAELELTDQAAVERFLGASESWAVINAAGWVRVDEAEANAPACMAANAGGALILAKACAARGLPMVGFSSDMVFDGQQARPYVESDSPCPLNTYGLSKAWAEAEILALDGQCLMVRTAAFFSPYDPHNFAAHVVHALSSGEAVSAADDLTVSPTYVPDLVDAVLDLLLDGETGMRHLANAGAVTWAGFARMLASSLDLDVALIQGVPAASFGWAAERPAYAALATERGQLMPSLDDAVARYAALLRQAQFEPSLTARSVQTATDLSRADDSTGPEAKTSSTKAAIASL